MRQDLVHLLLILDDGDDAAGIVEHVAELIGNRIGIDRNGNRAERLRGEKGPIEPRPIAADDRDRLAALDAEQRQARPRRRACSPQARTSSSFATGRDPCGAWRSCARARPRDAARAAGRCRAHLAVGPAVKSRPFGRGRGAVTAHFRLAPQRLFGGSFTRPQVAQRLLRRHLNFPRRTLGSRELSRAQRTSSVTSSSFTSLRQGSCRRSARARPPRQSDAGSAARRGLPRLARGAGAAASGAASPASFDASLGSPIRPRRYRSPRQERPGEPARL